jgi:hypothetical protein
VVNLSAAPIDFPCRISAASCCGDTIADAAIILNHLPPGIPVEATIQIPPHDSTFVETGISFVEHNAFHFYNVILQWDLDGNPTTYEDMARFSPSR